MYKKIDLNSWERKHHYWIFKDALIPHYQVTLRLDITHFKKATKAKGLPFSLAFIHVVTEVANEQKEFRYRFLTGDVVLYDVIHPSFTVLEKETDLFKVINAQFTEDIYEFVQQAQQQIALQEQYITGPPANDVFQFSSLPLVDFTQITHTYAGKSEKSNPMFDWGKYTEVEGVITMPFAIQVHHSFIDGIHVGYFVEQLQRRLNEWS